MRKISAGIASVCLIAIVPAMAQVKTGDLTTDLTGTVSAGYTGDYGNLTGSDHGVTLGGAANLTGSYYNPGFFSFNLQPFLNQSRSNSDYQSITDASGVTASTSIFSGSNFPGAVSFTKLLNSEGNFGIPGLANYTSHGDSDVLSIGWSEHVAKLPAIGFGYEQGASQYSIYGTNSNTSTNTRAFTTTATYSLVGFNFSSSFNYSTAQSLLPQIFSVDTPEKTGSDTTSYSVGIGHALPFHGQFSAGAVRSDLDYTSSEGNYNGTVDSAYGGLIFNPVERLTFGGNVTYLDNLTGQLYQALVGAGGAALPTMGEQSSHSLDITGFASYLVPAWHMSFNGTDQHQQQVFEGESVQADSLTGTATYSNTLLGGMLNGTGGVVRSQVAPSNATHLGFLGALNYSREIRRWSFAGIGNYAADQETLLASYLTNTFSYSGSASRRFGRRSAWSNVASGSRASLSGQSGSSSSSQAYSSSIFHKWISGTVAYSKSSGNAILTSSGLVATPIPVTVLSPVAVVLYGGHAVSFGVGATPIRGLSLSASYSQAYSNTEGASENSNNSTSQLTARVLYLVRKTYFQAGYSRLVQSFSASNTPPGMVGSFYFGLTRWFSFF